MRVSNNFIHPRGILTRWMEMALIDEIFRDIITLHGVDAAFNSRASPRSMKKILGILSRRTDLYREKYFERICQRCAKVH